MIVRSIALGFAVPDAEAAIATVYYPGDESSVDDARLTGAVAPDATQAPWPLVIILPGINVAPDSYRWLARRLVEAGYCAVTYAAIGSLGPAGQGITPGMNMAALAPDVIGTQCSATAIGPLLDRLRADARLADHIDFERIALGGHSAGGTIALHNSNPEWVPGLRAVFAYGAHTMVSTALGHAEASVVAVPSGVPILLLSGGADAVIAASRDRYRSDGAEHDPVGRTFAEGITSDRGDCWSVVVADGNHFTLCDPIDETSGRTFLEADLRADDTATRLLLADLVLAFLDDGLRNATTMADAVTRPGVAHWQQR